jgi:CRP-like cAMP-binding protein
MAVGMSIGDVLAAKQQQKKAVGIEDHSIPFYIIDPTGELIREQRRLMRSMHKQDELAKMSPDQREAYVLREKNRHPIERYLHNLEWPTLYPGWDMITAIALLFTAAVTPFEVGYLPAPKRADEPLFIINRIIDCIFIFDMLCAFFLMQRSDVTKDGGSAHEWEMRLPVLAASYIKGWFVIDVMSVAPSIFDILPVMGAGESAGAVKTMRTIRALRLIKLLRLVRTSKVVQRLAAYASMSSFTNTILSLALKFVCAVHMYACIVAIETTLVPSRLDSWMATHGYCRPVEDGDGFLDADSGGVVDADGVECVSTGLLYLACLKWAMGLIAGGGFPMFPAAGPYGAHYSASNVHQMKFMPGEDVMVMVLKCCGLLIWSLVFSSLLRAVNNADPDQVAFQRDWDGLNRFCAHNAIPPPMARELRRYVLETKQNRAADSRASIYAKLSPTLLQKAGSHINRSLMEFRCFARVRDVLNGDAFVIALTLGMTPKVFAPRDVIPNGRFYLITQGSAKVRREILGPGGYWGDDDVILDSPKLPLAVATTYLHVQAITRKDFQELRKAHPEAYKAMQRVVRWSAIRQLMLDNYREKRDQQILTRVKNSKLGLEMISASATRQSQQEAASHGSDVPHLTITSEPTFKANKRSWVQDAGGWV